METRKKRGGRRPGAGRPPNFTLFEKLAIHGHCRRVSIRLAQENAQQRADERFCGEEIEQGLEAFSRLTSADRRRVIALIDAGEDPPDDTSDEIVDAFSEMKSRRDALDRKGRGARGTSYGRRDAILAEVAEWASKKFKRDVTVNQVAEILKDRQGDTASVLRRRTPEGSDD